MRRGSVALWIPIELLAPRFAVPPSTVVSFHLTKSAMPIFDFGTLVPTK